LCLKIYAFEEVEKKGKIFKPKIYDETENILDENESNSNKKSFYFSLFFFIF